MRVRYTTGFAGHGFTIEPGDVRDVSEEDAKRLIERQCAELVELDDDPPGDDDDGDEEEQDDSLAPTHRCKVCGARWRLNPPSDTQPEGSWSLALDEKCGPCCDNAPMGEQIEPLEASAELETAALERSTGKRKRKRKAK